MLPPFVVCWAQTKLDGNLSYFGIILHPFCRCSNEDNFHRFWVCPRWERLRYEALQDLPVHVLRAGLPAISLTHGLLPMDKDLERMRVAAEAAGSLPAVRALHGPVWSDGSADHSADPLLRRSAWAAV